MSKREEGEEHDESEPVGGAAYRTPRKLVLVWFVTVS